jgi:tRNA A37 methylthiotransferase MiaB
MPFMPPMPFINFGGGPANLNKARSAIYPKWASKWPFRLEATVSAPRSGTPAANLSDDTRHEVEPRRLHHLQGVINGRISRINESRLGTPCNAFPVEGPSKRDERELMGRPECNRVVNFAAPARRRSSHPKTTLR